MTTPPRQYEVERELRERIKVELDARGIATAPTLFTLTGTEAQAGAVLTTAASQAPDEGSPGAESGDGELDDGG
jgi:hypothetical protein